MRRLIMLALLIGIVGAATAVSQPTNSSTLAATAIPFAVNAAADTCEAATLIPSLPWGDRTQFVNLLTQSPTDPVLGCMWGSPSRPQGYRTAWYRFVAPYSAQVTVDTFYSNYDTVLAVYTGTCGADNLVQVACNDDHQGFTSQVSFSVRKGETYYIEVADWHFDVYGTTLNIAVLINPVESLWQPQGNLPIPRSRHAVVAAGNFLYVIGGETEMGLSPSLTNSLQRLDAQSGAWVNLDPMPGSGYANTSAAVVGGKIYLPSGFTGNVSAYSGIHHIYDIASNFWSTGPTAPWPENRPLAWGTAVASQNPSFPGYFYLGGTADQPPIEAHSNTAAAPANAVLLFNTNTNTWLANPIADLTIGRYAHAAAWVQDRLCVVGGLGINDDNNNILLPNGECYRFGVGWQPVGGLNFPRYNAGSAVGPDGRWYIFGGLNGENDPVDITEYFDPIANSWHALPINYSLGGIPSNPARAWPRGAFIGSNLWVMGGNITGPVGGVLPTVEKIFLPPPRLFIPFLSRPPAALPNDTLATAYGLGLNQPQFHTFDSSTDYHDTFFFDIGESRQITARLTNIPISGATPSNYDLFLYNSNKVLLGSSQNPSNLDETITRNLAPGRYYLIVERVFPAGPPDSSPYRIMVEG